MQYKVINTKFRHYELQDSQNIPLGTMEMKFFFTFRSEIKLKDGKTYQIEPKGFWGTEFQLLEGDNELMHFKFDWAGRIKINTAQGVEYHVKRQNIFNPHYVLFDDTDTEMVILNPHYEWTKFKMNYDIDVNPSFTEVSPLLLLAFAAIISISLTRAGAAVAASAH